jgi:hypothetical protein
VAVADYLVAAGANKEVEIAALVGLQHVLDIEAVVAPVVLRWCWLPPTNSRSHKSRVRPTAIESIMRNMTVPGTVMLGTFMLRSARATLAQRQPYHPSVRNCSAFCDCPLPYVYAWS